jgi:hypothetical protein
MREIRAFRYFWPVGLIGFARGAPAKRAHAWLVRASTREYFHFFGLGYDKLRAAKPDALIMHSAR